MNDAHEYMQTHELSSPRIRYCKLHYSQHALANGDSGTKVPLKYYTFTKKLCTCTRTSNTSEGCSMAIYYFYKLQAFYTTAATTTTIYSSFTNARNIYIHIHITHASSA